MKPFELPPSPWQKRQFESQDSRVPFLACLQPRRHRLGPWRRASLFDRDGGDANGGFGMRDPIVGCPAARGRRLAAAEGSRRLPAAPQPHRLDRDRVIWEHLSPRSPSRYTALDKPVLEFKEFCSRFMEAVVA